MPDLGYARISAGRHSSQPKDMARDMASTSERASVLSVLPCQRKRARYSSAWKLFMTTFKVNSRQWATTKSTAGLRPECKLLAHTKRRGCRAPKYRQKRPPPFPSPLPHSRTDQIQQMFSQKPATTPSRETRTHLSCSAPGT